MSGSVGREVILVDGLHGQNRILGLIGEFQVFSTVTVVVGGPADVKQRK